MATCRIFYRRMLSCSPTQLRLFQSLFRGRNDVFARYWHSPRTGKFGYAPAKFHTGDYAPLMDEILLSHLKGDALIGIYPLLRDNTTWFLAVDFDGDKWREEAITLMHTATSHQFPCSLERSKSGNGDHIWFFFFHSQYQHGRRVSGGSICSRKAALRDNRPSTVYSRAKMSTLGKDLGTS